MDHLKILKRAFEITWRYRALWLVGLLLVLAGGGVTTGFRPTPPPGSQPGGRGASGSYSFPGRTLQSADWERIMPILIAIAVAIVLIFLLAILIGIAAAIVRYLTRVSLIEMVQSYEETGEEINFGGGLRLGWSRSAFYLFVINLSFYLPFALLMLLLIGPIIGLSIPIFATGSGAAIGFGVLLILLIIPISLLGILLLVAIVPVIEISYRTCVLQKLGPWEAIREGWALIRRNLGPTALQWLLLIGLRIAWGIVLVPFNLALVVVAFFVGALPGLVIGGLASLAFSWPAGLVAGLLVFIPIFILLVSAPNVALSILATVFYSTTWTLTYRELRVLDQGREDAEWVEPEGE
jgi:hypothetical protein